MSATTPERPAERLRVFIDSDVLFSGGASASGASHLVLQLAELGIIEALISQQVQTEVERNLALKLPAALPAMRALSDACCRTVADPSPRRRAEITEADLADAKDAAILAAALDAGCKWLITFNIRDYRPGDLIRIGPPGEFINRLRERLLTLADP